MVEKTITMGGIYWPLYPYGFAVNQLALRQDGQLFDVKSDVLKSHFTADDIARYAAYRRHFLLAEQTVASGSPEMLLDSCKLNLSSDSQLLNEFRRFRSDQHARDLQKFLISFPQPVNRASTPPTKTAALALTLSQHWRGLTIEGLKNGSYKSGGHESKSYPLPKSSDFGPLEIAYVFGETACFDLYAKEPYAVPYRRLFELDIVRDSLPLEKEIDSRPLQIVLTCCSFFADRIPDVVLYLVVDPERAKLAYPSKRDKQGEDQPPNKFGFISRAFYGISGSLRVERELWLERWVLRLGTAVSAQIKNSTLNKIDDMRREAAEFCAEAIVTLAATLMFADPAQLTAAITSQKLNLTELLLRPDIDQNILDASAKNILTSLGSSNELASDARKSFIIQHCLKSIDAGRQSIHQPDGAQLKGILALQVNTHLRHYASHGTLSARILLTGAPGGGKGAAAEEWHRLVMDNLFDKSFVVWFEKFNAAVVCKDTNKIQSIIAEVFTAKGPKWASYMTSLSRITAKIFILPWDLPTTDDGDTRLFKNQIKGCRWEGWEWPPKMSDDFPVFEPSRKYWKTLKALADALKIQETFGHAWWVKSKHPNRGTYGDYRSVIIAEYLYRFMGKVNSVVVSPEKNWSFNFFQLACGALGGEGAELIASMRRLFGYSPQSTDLMTAAPGLFQTCSYVGGTLFLDEIADAPVRVQDNLLIPLEERKVYRDGWETSGEDVDNVRIISATHKDLTEASKQYEESASESVRRGFRPDLITRLATTAPVQVVPITDYFNYADDGGVRSRARFRSEFARILSGLTKETFATEEFWGRVYDQTDAVLDQAGRMGSLPIGTDREEARAERAAKLSMRFFKNIAQMCKEQGTTDSTALASFILEKHIPGTVNYLTND